MQTITDKLTAALIAPSDSDAVAPSHTLKGVAKTLKQLAKQLTKQHAKQERAAKRAAVPSVKKQRKALALELLTALRPQLGLGTATKITVPKPIAKTVTRLAAKLIKQSAKATRKATRQLGHEETLVPVLKVIRLAPTANGRSTPAARSGRSKPATSNGALSAGAAKKELAATTSAA
jgi:hypothetical protein